MPLPPALIAVIGPVEQALLAAWIHHYRSLGIQRFHLAVHAPDHVSERQHRDLVAACRRLGITPAVVSHGPWHEHTNTELRDTLRAHAGPGWHLLADADEFHHYPAPIPTMIAEAQASGQPVVGGLLLDRVSPDGHLASWCEQEGLDRTFPLGGHLTHRLLHGDPRKIVLVRSDVTVASGNHRAPGHTPDPDTLACVHHFKWRLGILEDLQRRVERFGSGAWAEHTPAVRHEAARLLDHVAQHHGRINITDPDLGFRPATLDHLPDDWATQARQITTEWRPPTDRPE